LDRIPPWVSGIYVKFWILQAKSKLTQIHCVIEEVVNNHK